MCVVRCLSLIFTPLLFSNEPADVVGTVPGCLVHHIIHGRCWGMETDGCVGLCVCVFEGQNESSCGFFSLFTFFFMQNFCRELSCTILAIAASRKQPVSAHGTTHLSTARGTQAILLPSDLHLLLNDKLKTSKQRMQTRRPMLIPQQTHSLICLLTVLFIPLRFEPTE